MNEQTNYGKVSLVAGIMQIIFNSIGPSFLGIAGLVILAINIIATTKVFRNNYLNQRKFAIIGIFLSIIMVSLGLVGVQISGAIFDYLWETNIIGQKLNELGL